MAQSLAFDRSRFLASTSMAFRISETRSSPSSSKASRRAVVPFASGRVIRSGNSLRRPTPRGFSYVRDSVNGHLFVCTVLTTYHRYGISSIVDTNGDAEVTFQLDTTGAIYDNRHGSVAGRAVTKWEDLSPFTQGYIEALFSDDATQDALMDEHGRVRHGFSDLAPETLARIITDCEAYLATHEHRKRCVDSETQGGSFWRIRQAAGYARDSRCCDGRFEPLTVQLGDDGKVRFQDTPND